MARTKKVSPRKPVDPASRNVRELQKNTKQLRELNSFGRNFLMSLVRGVGVTLGATIVTGLILAWAYQAYTSSVSTIPILEKILPKSSVEPYFNR